MNAENTNITCPDCRGALKRIDDGDLIQYECRVGHAYSPQSAVAAHADTEENALWAAIVALEEGADLMDDVAKFIGGDVSHELDSNAGLRRGLAKRVREILKDLQAPHLL